MYAANQLEHEKFEQIFRENYTRLYYHAYTFLNDEELSKDVINDVFEYIWRNYEKYHQHDPITPLLYRLVRNCCIDHLRHKKYVIKHIENAGTNAIECSEDHYQDHDLRLEKVLQRIDTLPDQTKNVFTRCFVDGKKYQQVAEELSISVNTVKTHITKALSILRKEFSEKY